MTNRPADRVAHDEEGPRRVLVTGATGYIGGRLAPRLLDEGFEVTCLVRSRRKLEHRDWSKRVRVVVGDANDPAVLAEALDGVEAAFYLLHSMVVAGDEYARRDARMAERFGAAAARHGVQRIVYLGGLGETGDDLSEHLESRRDVEHALAESGVPVTVLRAAMIIGSGSASYEILRYLVERLPVMVTPLWVNTECQPIGVADVLRYLTQCLDVPETTGETIDIGGRDVVTYRDLMDTMADVRGLRRRVVIPVPILTPRLSSFWIHYITPIGHRIARPLAEGLRNRVVCRNDLAEQLMPGHRSSAREAMELARSRLKLDQVETSWSDAGVMPGDPDWAGGEVFVDRRIMDVKASREATFRAICRVGGGHGWYAADWLWRIRGWMDQLAGGPGLRRGRRSVERIGYGDALDFWRVTDIEPARHLELRAEMKLPGIATLSFMLDPNEPDRQESDPPLPTTGCRLVQIARFQPKGLLGLAYWYCVLPLHGIVFKGMQAGIRRSAEQSSDNARPEGGMGAPATLRS